MISFLLRRLGGNTAAGTEPLSKGCLKARHLLTKIETGAGQSFQGRTVGNSVRVPPVKKLTLQAEVR